MKKGGAKGGKTLLPKKWAKKGLGFKKGTCEKGKRKIRQMGPKKFSVGWTQDGKRKTK